MDPSTLPEVESQHEDMIDFEKYRLEKNVIESAEVIRIPSKFAKSEDKKQHKLRIVGTVVETVEKEDKKTHEKTTYEFRPTALINMVEDEDGKLLGFPEAEDSTWGKVKKTLNIKDVKELIGKELPMAINQANSSAPKFLTYMLG